MRTAACGDRNTKGKKKKMSVDKLGVLNIILD